MGNATLGSTTAPGTTYTASETGPATWWPSGAFLVSTEEMYIDRVYCWCGASGSACNFTFGVWSGGGAQIGGNTNTYSYGVGYGWNSGDYSPGSYNHIAASGTDLELGFYASGSSQTSSNNDSGGYYLYQGSGLNNNWTNGTLNKYGHIGILHVYCTYWKRCAISSVDAGPFAPGQTFHVFGNSFQAGGVSVSLNGTNCPTFSVDSDSQLTVTVPSGATTGTVTVNSYAGSATSSGTVTVSSARVYRSTVWTSASGVYAERSSVETLATEVAVFRTSVWTPGA